MKKMVCDICGIEGNDCNYWASVLLPYLHWNVGKCGFDDFHYDICPSCQSEVEKLIKGLKNEKNNN